MRSKPSSRSNSYRRLAVRGMTGDLTEEPEGPRCCRTRLWPWHSASAGLRPAEQQVRRAQRSRHRRAPLCSAPVRGRLARHSAGPDADYGPSTRAIQKKPDSACSRAPGVAGVSACPNSAGLSTGSAAKRSRTKRNCHGHKISRQLVANVAQRATGLVRSDDAFTGRLYRDAGGAHA